MAIKINELINNSMEIEFCKARLSSAEAILGDLANIKSINKFEIEELVERAKNHVYPTITQGGY